MKTIIDHYADYTRWADQRYIDRLLQESDEVLDRSVNSSFPSLRATMLHIRNAENTWRCRIDGVPSSWPAEEDGSMESVRKYSIIWHKKVKGMSGIDLLQEISYSDTRGNVHRQKAWQIIMHCCNHSTQHRGQLITMMRSLGLSDIPPNDMVVYQRSL